MLEQDKQDDLRRLYNLLSRIENGLDPLRKIFKEHVKEDGIERIQVSRRRRRRRRRCRFLLSMGVRMGGERMGCL